MKREPKSIQVEIEYTEGYQQRFTLAILKIWENRLLKEELQKEESA